MTQPREIERALKSLRLPLGFEPWAIGRAKWTMTPLPNDSLILQKTEEFCDSIESAIDLENIIEGLFERLGGSALSDEQSELVRRATERIRQQSSLAWKSGWNHTTNKLNSTIRTERLLEFIDEIESLTGKPTF